MKIVVHPNLRIDLKAEEQVKHPSKSLLYLPDYEESHNPGMPGS
ncbi:MAG: hypothetical protein WCJ01_02345 [Ignavibacteria bacterium]